MKVGIVLRTLFCRILVIFRLALVLSLVGYTMPNAYAAMHGSIYSDSNAVVEAGHDQMSHAHGIEADHADGHDDQAGSNLAKQDKKDCCQDFCFGIALPISCQSSKPLTLSSALRFFDDNHVTGTRPSLHRPPNI